MSERKESARRGWEIIVSFIARRGVMNKRGWMKSVSMGILIIFVTNTIVQAEVVSGHYTPIYPNVFKEQTVGIEDANLPVYTTEYNPIEQIKSQSHLVTTDGKQQNSPVAKFSETCVALLESGYSVEAIAGVAKNAGLSAQETAMAMIGHGISGPEVKDALGQAYSSKEAEAAVPRALVENIVPNNVFDELSDVGVSNNLTGQAANRMLELQAAGVGQEEAVKIVGLLDGAEQHGAQAETSAQALIAIITDPGTGEAALGVIAGSSNDRVGQAAGRMLDLQAAGLGQEDAAKIVGALDVVELKILSRNSTGSRSIFRGLLISFVKGNIIKSESMRLLMDIITDSGTGAAALEIIAGSSNNRISNMAIHMLSLKDTAIGQEEAVNLVKLLDAGENFGNLTSTDIDQKVNEAVASLLDLICDPQTSDELLGVLANSNNQRLSFGARLALDLRKSGVMPAEAASIVRQMDSTTFDSAFVPGTRSPAKIVIGNSPETSGLDVGTLRQGKNECGPTSLAMVLNYYGANIDPGDNLINSSYLLGTHPIDMVKKAEDLGYDARIVSGGTLEDLAYLIDRGIPVIVLTSSDRDHYVVVTGYERDNSGKISQVHYNDPANGKKMASSAMAFEKRWAEAKICSSKLYIAIAPRGSEQQKYLPRNNYTMTAERTILYGLSQAGNGLMGIFYPFDNNGKFIGPEQWLKNIITSIGGVIGGATRVTAGALGAALEWLGETIGGDVGKMVSGLGNALVKLGNTIADTIENIYNKLINLGSQLWEGIKDAWKGITNFVSDVFKSVGDELKRAGKKVAREVKRFFKKIF